jgi:hypothetical protein
VPDHLQVAQIDERTERLPGDETVVAAIGIVLLPQHGGEVTDLWRTSRLNDSWSRSS